MFTRMKLIIATLLLVILMAFLSFFYGSDTIAVNRELTKSKENLALIEEKRSDELEMLRESATLKEDYRVPRSDLVVSFEESITFAPEYRDDEIKNDSSIVLSKGKCFLISLAIASAFLILWILIEKAFLWLKKRK